MEEEGLKEENPEKSKNPASADKVGWIKKSSGGLWSFWKERYIHLCKTQLFIYEDEEEQKCVESLELNHYDRCQDLRALLKRKNRFILIRSPGCKVQDIKFQASTPEEKELWIKALNDGINRGKNKIFDEVKVDESLSLDHVTRGRAKVAHGRRPPTRSHLKEVASAASDGILRLDLDVPDSGPSDIILATSDAAEIQPSTPKPPKPPVKVPVPPPEKPRASLTPDLQVRKPPVPPVKPLKEVATPGEDMKSAEVDDTAADAPGEVSEECKSTPVEEDVGEAKPPVPPPKILLDKMKVTWDGPASELPDVEAENPLGTGSQEDLSELGKGTNKQPTSPPEMFKATVVSSDNSTSEGRCQPDEDSAVAVNGIEGSGTRLSAFQDEKEQDERPSEPEAKEEGPNVQSKDQTDGLQPVGGSPATKPRSCSLGNLLSEPIKKTSLWPDLQQGAIFHVVQMEKKIAYEKGQTEKLLKKVRGEDLEPTQKGNGPAIDAEGLLGEAAEQLRQATQVLQEVRNLGERRRDPTECRKGVLKDLVTVYRRSAP